MVDAKMWKLFSPRSSQVIDDPVQVSRRGFCQDTVGLQSSRLFEEFRMNCEAIPEGDCLWPIEVVGDALYGCRCD